MTVATDITIHLSGALCDYCRSVRELAVSASTVRGALAQLEHESPGVYRGVCDETGAVRQHVGVFVNETHIREREGLDTTLVPGDTITILPAVSGG
jgi:molybdopterin synthase sulfur carrier subunit